MINARSVDFSGAPGQVCYSFRTAIHYFDVRGVRHIANLSNPRFRPHLHRQLQELSP
jgi:hypothetical protein